MEIPASVSQKIIEVAKSYLNQKYSKEFDCVAFVREVYKEVDIHVPKLKSHTPPASLNITKVQLSNPPIGHLMFLKDPEDPRKHRAWTHIVLIVSKDTCIHCSLFFGRKVVISSFAEIFNKYEFVESTSVD